MKTVRATLVVAVALLLVCAVAAQAATTIIESRISGGAQNSLFTMSGPAVTTAKSTAAGLTGTGSYYAGDTVPVKYGDWAFTPAAGLGGYYDVYATWANYTTPGGCNWLINNAGAAYANTTLQQTGSNGNAWRKVNGASALKFNAGTSYKTRLNTAATGTSGKRVYFDSIKWESATPTVATLTGPANNAVNVGTQVGPLVSVTLSWTAGSYNSFFDVFFGTTSNPTTKIGDNLPEGTTSLVVNNLPIYTKYYWKVTAKNVDASVTTSVRNFTTIPEPGSILALGTGLIGLAGVALRRRRA